MVPIEPKPRVVLVAGQFPHPPETFIARRFQELLARGWDVHVVCNRTSENNWSFFPELAAIPGVRDRVHERRAVSPRAVALLMAPVVLIRCLLRARGRTVRYIRRGWRLLGARVVIRRLYQDEPLVLLEPDVVHFVFGTYARGSEHLGQTLGCALAVSFQGADLNYAGLDLEPGFYTDVWRSMDAIHFLSEDLLRRAGKRGYSRDARARIVLPGVDSSAFQPTQRVRDGNEPLRVLSVGRLHWKKGYEYALHAIRGLLDRGVDCRYRVVGDGDYRPAVLYTVFDLGLQDVVELVGSRSSSGVREEMQWADVLLHAAISEGFCYAVVEAQAMELPVVTSDADGLAENVADGVTGFVTSRRDPSAMADKLACLAGEVELRRRMGAAGRDRVRREFDPEREIDGFESLYLEAIKRRGD